jgi:hypothetical protein
MFDIGRFDVDRFESTMSDSVRSDTTRFDPIRSGPLLVETAQGDARIHSTGKLGSASRE